MKPRNWIPVGWIPCYDESRDKRRKTGFESTSARKIRLYHQCWIEFLAGWAERTKDAMILPWADGVTRSTRLFIGGVMGDQQEGDKYTGEPCLCHRCFAPRKRYLDTDQDFEVKTMRKVRQRVELAAAGGVMKGSDRQRIVKWDPDGRNVRPGPGIIAFIRIMCIIHIIPAKTSTDINILRSLSYRQCIILIMYIVRSMQFIHIINIIAFEIRLLDLFKRFFHTATS